MLTPFMFLIAPLRVFENLRSKSQWIAPCFFTILGLLGKTILSNSWGDQSLIFLAHSLYLYVIIITFFIAVLWSAISIFLYLSFFLITADTRVPYKSLFSIVSYCGVIFLFGEISNFFLIRANIIDSMLFTLQKRFPIGLDILLLGTSPSPALAIFLHSINPFSIWYFTILSVGLSIVTGLSKTKARMLSFMLWFIAVGFAMSVLLITGETSLHIKF
jgi:hypothetical protein